MSKVLLDTNVLIYSIDEESKYFKKAQNLISEQIHDFEIISIALAHQIVNIATFNIQDFKRVAEVELYSI